MKDYDTIFLDRDGTINPDPGYISKLDDFQFFDFTISSLKKLADGGNRFCIVTNQSDVDLGLIQKIKKHQEAPPIKKKKNRTSQRKNK